MPNSEALSKARGLSETRSDEDAKKLAEPIIEIFESLVSEGADSADFVNLRSELHNRSPGEIDGKHSRIRIETFDVDSFNVESPDALIVADLKYNILAITDAARDALKIEDEGSVVDLLGDDFEAIVDDEGEYARSIRVRANNLSYLAQERRVWVDDQSRHLIFIKMNLMQLSGNTKRLLRNRFKFTNAEFSILGSVLMRRSLQEISDEKNVSLATVRKHVANIIEKTGANSLLTAILVMLEYSRLCRDDTSFNPAAYIKDKTTHTANLPRFVSFGGHDVEYACSEEIRDKTLLYLHSLEDAAPPPTSFFETAERHGFSVCAPFRSGFGKTSIANTITEDCRVINNLVDHLGIEKFLIVAHNTAVPGALELASSSARAEGLVLVNFVPKNFDKLSEFNPRWLRGFLKLAASDPKKMSFGIKLIQNFIQAVGPRRFYKELFLDCAEDKAYCNQHDEFALRAIEELVCVSPEVLATNVRKAIKPLNTPNFRNIDVPVVAIRGECSMSAYNTELENACQSIGMPYKLIPDAGRFCLYQQAEIALEFISTKFCKN